MSATGSWCRDDHRHPGYLPDPHHACPARTGAAPVRLPRIQLVHRHRRTAGAAEDWLRPFARFDARDHFTGGRAEDTLRHRVDAFLAENGISLPGGRITALLQARVLGYVFNPLSLFWCHDADGALRAVIAEVHNTYGQRHAYLLPSDERSTRHRREEDVRVTVQRVDGHYVVRAPRPGATLAVSITLHRDNQPPFVAPCVADGCGRAPPNWPGCRSPPRWHPCWARCGSASQGITLWLRRVPVVPR